MATATEQIQAMFPWLPQAAIDAYNEAYTSGSAEPWLDVRQDPQYEVWFPGNLTDDGQARYSEENYMAVRESYKDVFRAMNLLPDACEVSPAEFEQRASLVYDRIISASDQIKEAFAAANGFDITTEGILASALDPDLGDKILSQEVGLAEISGAGAESGFNITREHATRIFGQDVSLDEARNVFGQAQALVPVLDILARRHSDPDDTFDLNEFTEAEIFNDPFENARMRRLVAQERSAFGSSTSIRARDGALTGLVAE